MRGKAEKRGLCPNVIKISVKKTQVLFRFRKFVETAQKCAAKWGGDVRKHFKRGSAQRYRLYDILDRVSCWCCKNKNRRELKSIYEFLPQYWEQLKELQAQIPMPMKPYSRKGVLYGNVFDLEKVFEQEIRAEASGSAPKQKRRWHEQSR